MKLRHYACFNMAVRRVLPLLLSFALVMLNGAPPAAAGTAADPPAASTESDLASAGPAAKSDIDSKKDEREGVQDRLGGVRDELGANAGENELLLGERRELEEQKAASEMTYGELVDLLNMYEEQIREADLAFEEAERDCDEQRELLKSRVRSMYMNSGGTVLEALLSSGDITDFLEKVELFSVISNHDNDVLENYKAAKEEVEYKRAMQRLIAEQTGEKAAVQQRELDELNLSREDLEMKIAELQSRIDGLNSLEDELEAQSERLEKEINELVAKAEAEAEAARKAAEEKAAKEKAAKEKAAKEKAAKEKAEKEKAAKDKAAKDAEKAGAQGGSTASQAASSKKGSGEFLWPAPGYSRISSSFGSRMHPIKKKVLQHTGIDIAAPSGASVVAAKGGTVIIAEVQGGYGKTVVISHGNGLTTLYGHCSKLLVESGQTVKAGAVIAKVGSTGVSTGPHLHFEVRKNGSPVQPLNYL